ncbi:sigma-54-dependent Fis family transcriptional re gulator [Desulfonema ishimotonii]|uniref:Sigma-54-dependent Fis family transcriptional re gulator n=1 Tax=Desulfonema ishimotonii TaxID=45657 RepID=A0A401FVV8_9BACT|nr:sigma-54 dependent transcriptional regulator [Desulfonema ishimotonii]GBC61095.1 sigma-54-dependent Fis family transcriptional re gulator [Desulfonema ishimotonii]
MQTAHQTREKSDFHGMIGRSDSMRRVYDLIGRFAGMDNNVLITGETGTGKELVARALHAAGPRAKGRMIRVNCAALCESLIESEFFGHTAGAFTDAAGDRAGYFEAADGGTIFLDEIAELSPRSQAKLLHVLDRKMFEHVGESQTVGVDVRIIGATNADLKTYVREGKLRQDFCFRLREFSIGLPPLRDHMEDIPLLADHFIRLAGSGKKGAITGISHEVRELLMGYAWPGNVRQLKNIITFACAICPSGELTTDYLPGGFPESEDRPDAEQRLPRALKRKMLVDALEANRWNKSRAARWLGMGRSTLYRKLAEFGITAP